MSARPPSGSNTYIPSYDASGVVVAYTRNPAAFRVNRYVKSLKVDKDQGYYLSLDADEPYRVVAEADYAWEDGADAPKGLGEKMDFEYKAYHTFRRAFPFAIGRKAVDQASWPILAQHARKTSTKAMVLRTLKAATLITTSANWPAANTAAAGGAWSTSSEAALYIQNDINSGLLAIEKATGGIVSDEDSLKIVMNPIRARSIAASPEYRNYIKGSPDALSSLTDHKNPNRKYGLAPFLYGLELVVENAVRVSSRKVGTLTKDYIWPGDKVAIVSRPEGLRGAEGEESLDFSTVAFRFYEEMTVESKDDPDNRRTQGRVVEDYEIQLQAGQAGYLFTSVS